MKQRLLTVQWGELRRGIQAELPIALGGIPFGMIYGVLALASGLSPALAQAMSAIVFAGSAQFIGAQLIGTGTPAPILLLTTFVVNLRHLLYSTSMTAHMRHLSAPWRWLLAYLLTDETFAVTILHYDDQKQDASNKHYFFLGAGLTEWTSWQLSTAVGIFLGTQVPDSWSLDFAMPLTFLALVFPVLKDRPAALAAVVAGLTAVLAASLPYNLDLIIATLTGIFVGYLAESWQK